MGLCKDGSGHSACMSCRIDDVDPQSCVSGVRTMTGGQRVVGASGFRVKGLRLHSARPSAWRPSSARSARYRIARRIALRGFFDISEADENAVINRHTHRYLLRCSTVVARADFPLSRYFYSIFSGQMYRGASGPAMNNRSKTETAGSKGSDICG